MGEVVPLLRPAPKVAPVAPLDADMVAWAFNEPQRQAYRLGVLGETLAVMRALNEPPEIIAAFEQGARATLRTDAEAAAELRNKALVAGYVLPSGA